MINHLTNKFKHYVIWRIVIVSLVIISVAFALIGSVVSQISQDYAALYTSEVVCNMEAYLTTKNLIVDQLDKMDSLYTYLAAPTQEHLNILNDDVKKINVFSEEDTLFFADIRTRSMHFWGENGFEYVGTLDEQRAEDQWFYRSLSSKSRINLNIDRDRFIDVFNVWINYQMMVDGEVVGICGVGLSLDRFLEEIHFLETNQGAQSIVVNQFGAIQIALDQNKILQNSFSAEVPYQNSLFSFYDTETFRTEILEYFTLQAPNVFTLKDSEFNYAAIENIENSNWHVLTFYKSKSLVTFTRFLPLFVFIGFFLIVLSILVIRRFDKMLGRPFTQLIQSLNKSSESDLTYIEGMDREDEFGEIARSVEKLSRKWVQDIPVGIFHVTDSLEVLYGNKTFLALFGVSDIQTLNHAIVEKPHTVFPSKEVKQWLTGLMGENEPSYRFEMELANERRETFWADIRLIRKENYYEGTIIPIKERRAHVNAVIDIARTDALTGLLNQRGLSQLLVNEIAKIPEQLSVIFIDLDRFKWINEMYGHDVCDQVLLEVVELVQSQLIEEHHFARWSGEAFVVVLPGIDLSRSKEIAERLRAKIEASRFTSVAQLTASFAISPYLVGDTLDVLFTRLVALKNTAKAKGRNCVESYQFVEIPIIHMPWQTQYECGEKDIDSEHRLLFEMVNIAMTDHFKRLTPKHQLDELRKIVDMLKNHFKHEEDILRGRGYPAERLNDHVLKHLELIQSVEQRFVKVVENHVAWIDFYMYLISEVIYKHMIEEDKLFFDFFKGKN